MFLLIMKDFRAQRSDVSGAIAKVKELFKGHDKLISGFNIFLPKGSELALEHDEAAPQTKKIDFAEALNVVTKIKKRFQNDEHVYIAFLKILNEFRKGHKDINKVYNEGHKDINKVYNEISILLKGHADLINEFTRFLFPKAEPVSAKNVETLSSKR
nr:paired amphipathic helix protein sin3-like 1 [Quercus suber]